MATSVTDISNGINTRLLAVLGSSYKQLPFVNDISKNSLSISNMMYGNRPLPAFEAETVTKRLTFLHTFEIIVTTGYSDSNIDDAPQVAAALGLYEQMLEIHEDMENTRCGVPATVLNVLNASMSEPEYLENEKVVVLRATIDVLYRNNL